MDAIVEAEKNANKKKNKEENELFKLNDDKKDDDSSVNSLLNKNRRLFLELMKTYLYRRFYKVPCSVQDLPLNFAISAKGKPNFTNKILKKFQGIFIDL